MSFSDDRAGVNPEAPRTSSIQLLGIFAALTGLCFAAYGSTLGGYLYCDDFMFLGYAHKICRDGGFGWLVDLFTTPMPEVQASQLVFRPLPVAWFVGEYKLIGLNVTGLHAVNLLMYSVTTSIVFLLARAFMTMARSPRPTLIAFVAAALFAVSPLHVEVVSWVTEQIDMLCTLLFLTSCLFFVHAYTGNKPSPTFYYLSLLLAFGTMLTKEHGVMIPVVLTAYYFVCCASGTLVARVKNTVSQTILFWALLAVYFALRVSALGTFTGGYYGQNADSIDTFIWRWKNFHGAFQLLFPVNQTLVDLGNPIFLAFGLVYLAIGAVAFMSLRAGALALPQRKVFIFLALWTVISAVPPMITWGLDKALSGARHTYLVGVPFLIFVVGLFLSKIQASKTVGKEPVDFKDSKRSGALAIAGTGALGALLCVYLWATLLNTQAWSSAGLTMLNFRSSVSEAAREVSPGKKVVMLYLPANKNGAHLFYHAQHADLFKPPFINEDLSDKIEFPIKTLFSHNATLVNTAQVRDLAKRGHQFFYWDNKTGSLKAVEIELAEQLNLPIDFVKTERTADDTVCRYVFKIENPDDFRRAEFIEFKARCASGKLAKIRPELTWDTSVDPGFVDLKLRKVICRMEPKSQFSTYHFSVSESKNWLCSRHTGRIYIDAPRDLQIDTGSLRLIDGRALVPKLSYTGNASTRLGVWELGEDDGCTLSYDASAIPGADHLKLEMSRPSVAYESLLASLRSLPAKHVTAKSFATRNTTGTVTLPKSIFPKKAAYEFRVSARDKEGKLLGYFGDPVAVILKPARW